MNRLVLHGALVVASPELPAGVEARGVAGSRRRPGCRVFVRPELVSSPRLGAVVARAVNDLWRARA